MPKTHPPRGPRGLPFWLLWLTASCTPKPEGPVAEVSSEVRREPRPSQVDAAHTNDALDAAQARPATAAAPDAAGDESLDVQGLLALGPARSTSLGSPMDGSLLGGVPLPWEGPGFRYNPRRRPEARFGTVEMVQALARAAAKVQRRYPDARLTINDLGFARGGPISQHGSHQSGRDVDVLFFLRDAKRKIAEPIGVPIDPKGRGIDFGDLSDPRDDRPLRIDLPRTWALLQALIEDPESKLQRVFVAEHLRRMLLDYAEKSRAPRAVIDAFADRSCQPEAPHDDHFHFRFFCSPDDIRAGCEDTFPLYPWRRAELEAAGVQAKMAGKRRNKLPFALKSTEAAKREAGAMHAKVKAFLKERESWAKKPHPGRAYCP